MTLKEISVEWKNNCPSPLRECSWCQCHDVKLFDIGAWSLIFGLLVTDKLRLNDNLVKKHHCSLVAVVRKQIHKVWEIRHVFHRSYRFWNNLAYWVWHIRWKILSSEEQISTSIICYWILINDERLFEILSEGCKYIWRSLSLCQLNGAL